ncbi:MAG: tol-pal system protein YbgF [Burkholderiales bacterium]
MRLRAARVAVLGAVFAAALAAPAPAWAIFGDDEARARIDALRKEVQASQRAVDERLAKLEDRRALLDLASQIEALKADIAKLRGQVEVLVNLSEQAEKRQKDLYLDIDTRLRKLEQVQEGAAAGGTPQADAGIPAAETKAYEAALNQFKLGNYPMAISAFQGFMVTYPGSKLAPSAQYWIGNAHYARRDFKQAIAAQQRVVAQWPDDPKAPDALLNMASSQEARGDRRGARSTLEALVTKYPASPAAASAKQRLAQSPAGR